MDSYLCLSIRLLDSTFHGRRDRGEHEWPPSPMRLFQSLVAAAAGARRQALATRFHEALEWLEQQPAPMLLAPKGVSTPGYRISVPNNAMDVVARAWSRGNYSNVNDANPATHRTMKLVQRTHLLGGDAIQYLWSLSNPPDEGIHHHVETLGEIARSVVALG